MKRFALILFALPACNINPDHSAPPPPDSVEVVQRIALNTLVNMPNFVGVSVDPISNDIVLIESNQGIFSLDGENIANENDLMPGWDARPYTDVAALGNGQYALTVQADGLLFDKATGVTSVYFCYEPGFMPQENYQLTNSLAYNHDQGTLIAQPQTFNAGELVDSEVAEYTLKGGQPSEWFVLSEDFSAGGMTADGDDLLLGRDDLLFSYSSGDTNVTPLVNLKSLEIHRIEGIALMPSGNLLIIDGDDQELVELSGWR